MEIENEPGKTVSGTVVKNGVKIIDFTITQGDTLFEVDDEFTFELSYEFDGYRSSLAAPDWDKMGSYLGRTPASTFIEYPTFELE